MGLEGFPDEGGSFVCPDNTRHEEKTADESINVNRLENNAIYWNRNGPSDKAVAGLKQYSDAVADEYKKKHVRLLHEIKAYHKMCVEHNTNVNTEMTNFKGQLQKRVIGTRAKWVKDR